MLCRVHHPSNESAVGGDRLVKGLVRVNSLLIQDERFADLRSIPNSDPHYNVLDFAAASASGDVAA